MRGILLFISRVWKGTLVLYSYWIDFLFKDKEIGRLDIVRFNIFIESLKIINYGRMR